MSLTRIPKILAKTVAVVALSAAVSSANAIVVNFFNGSTLYATMTTSGATDFDLNFIGTGSAGAFLNDLEMAGPTGTFANIAGDGGDATASYSAAGFTDQGKTYNWHIFFETANNTNRITTGEHFLFSITPTPNSVWNFDLLHINAFDAAGNSIKLDGCIDGSTGCGGGGGGGGAPEPESLALVGLALAAAGFAGKRKRRTAALG